MREIKDSKVLFTTGRLSSEERKVWRRAYDLAKDDLERTWLMQNNKWIIGPMIGVLMVILGWGYLDIRDDIKENRRACMAASEYVAKDSEVAKVQSENIEQLRQDVGAMREGMHKMDLRQTIMDGKLDTILKEIRRSNGSGRARSIR